MQGSEAVSHHVHPKIAATVAGKGNCIALYYRVYALSVSSPINGERAEIYLVHPRSQISARVRR